MLSFSTFVKVLAVSLPLALLSWIVYVVGFAGFGIRETSGILGFGSGATGTTHLPLDQVENAIEVVRQRMIDANSTGAIFAVVDDVLGWLSFATTSTITLIAAFVLRSPGAPSDAQETARGVRLIVFLAALAAVLTCASSLTSAAAQTHYLRADTIRLDLTEARREILEANNAAEEREILDGLLLSSRR